MKNYLDIKLVLMLVVFASSCTGEGEKAAYSIQLSEAAIPYFDDALVGIVSVHKFENPDDVSYGMISRVLRSHSHYLMVVQTDLGNQVFKYDNFGNYIGRIGQIGKGPGEYTNASDIAADLENGVVYILDSSREVKAYDWDGNFIQSFQENISTPSFSVNQQGGFFQYTALDEGYGVVLTDSSGKMIHEYMKKTTQWYPIEEKTFQRSGDVVYFREAFSNTVFELNEGNIRPLISFLWEGKNYMPEYDQLDLFGIYNLFAVEGNLLLFSNAIVGKNNIYACFSNEKEGIFNHIMYNLHEEKVSTFRIRHDHGLFFAMLMNEDEQPGFFIRGLNLKELWLEFPGKFKENDEWDVDEEAVYLVFLEF